MLENGQITSLNLKDILPNRFQPRLHFDEQKLEDLADSIRRYGVIQPIVVRQIGNKYEIIAGERRFKASKLANKETIPAIILNLSDRDSEEIALLENIQREDLTPIEEAVSYKRILDIGYITQEKLAKQLGKSQSSIANKIRLLNLADAVQDALLHGKISERHARSLLRLHDNRAQEDLLNKIINERLTVKMTDKEIERILEDDESTGEEKKIVPPKSLFGTDEEIEELTLETPKRRAIPVASHRIIRANPPKELEEKREEGNFMDVDKIMAEAKDINTPESEKPVNDIADLMKQNPETVTSPLVQSEPAVQSEPSIMPNPNNKFVTFNPNVNNQDENIQPNSSIQSEVSFDTMFNSAPNGVVNTEMPSSPSVTNNSDAGLPNNQNINNSFNTGINQEQYNPQPMPSVPLMQPEPQSIPAMPDLQNVQPVPMNNEIINSNVQMEPINPNLGQESIKNNLPNFGVQPEINEMTAPVTDIPIPSNSGNSFQPLDLMTPQTENIGPAPIINQAEQSSMQPEFNSVPVASTMDIPDYDIIETSDNTNTTSLDSIPNEVQMDDTTKFRQVINLIRNCANEIEKMGYHVDLDEVDLEDNYQVTFKINKE